MFHLFSSLEILSFHLAFKRLDFGREKRMPPLGSNNIADAAVAGMLWYTSRIAQHIPSLQAFYIYEEHYHNEVHGCGDRWSVIGWIEVVRNARKVVGTLGKCL